MTFCGKFHCKTTDQIKREMTKEIRRIRDSTKEMKGFFTFVFDVATECAMKRTIEI
jgi:hypothetical protein